jgi:predicted permease
MLKDLRHGVRVLLSAKGWTAVVVASLAIGIGANAVLFSAVNGLLLQKVAVREPDTLVRFRHVGINQMATNSSDYGPSAPIDGQQVRATFSYSIYRQFVAGNRTLTDLFACAPAGMVNVVADGSAALAEAFFSTGNYYRALGIGAQLGRTIEPEDDRPDAPPVAVLGDRYWRTRFAADPAVLGRSIVVNGVPLTIVGVLPRDYHGVQRPVGNARDIGMPLALDALVTGGSTARVDDPTYFWLQVMGRLAPGESVERVQANFERVFADTARANMEAFIASLPDAERAVERDRRRTPTRLHVDSGSRGIYDPSPNDVRAVAVLGAVVGLVLLMVCVNVASLLLSRAAARGREISIRLSLGATRGRLVRQLLTESLLLAACGASLGVALSRWGQVLLPGALGTPVPLDWRFLLFVLAVTTATAVVFGTAPALRATGTQMAGSIQEGSRAIAGRRGLLTRALLVAQVAIAILLLAGAGLFLRTLDNLRRVDVGFDADRVLLFSVSPGLNGYDPARATRLYGELLERLQGLGGVQAAALSRPALLSGSTNTTRIVVRGEPLRPEDQREIHRMVVSPSFFETMQLRVLAGRSFGAADGDAAPKVAIVNETAARRYFPDGAAVGRRFGPTPETNDTLEVVGIVSDAKYNNLREAAPPTMYVPYAQNPPTSGVAFELRTTGDPLALVPAVRETVRQIDATLPITDVGTQAANLEGRLTQERVFARAYALFGGLAALIAAIGLFGLMSHGVARRIPEIGIRMALGARSADMLRMIMGEALALVGAGVALGVAGVLAAGRLVAAMLYGVGTGDAATLAGAVALMVTVAAAAAFIPARRAAAVDPMTALRHE